MLRTPYSRISAKVIFCGMPHDPADRAGSEAYIARPSLERIAIARAGKLPEAIPHFGEFETIEHINETGWHSGA